MIRRATITDVKQIQRIINFYAERDEMLSRSLNELYENIRDFFVFTQGGKIIGCSALHVCWEDLGEIKALAVQGARQRKGIGTKLVEACLHEARKLGIKKLFVLTYKPDFFKRFDFTEVDKMQLPHKIWTECIKCVKFPDCDEVALTREI
ncbi:MAG: N-acetyltransferase [Candidatus Omnitrophica bacterium]|nr:N-acetyltransferase [Candidatus Omnitrophota bacterium]